MKEILFKQNEADLLIKIVTQFFNESANATERKQCASLISKLENSKKKIKVSSAKGKGRSFQYWVCSLISKYTGIPYRQNDDECLIHSREMGQHNVDIVLRGKAKQLFPFSVECKAQENINLRQFVEQARTNTQDNTDWLLFIKKKTIGRPLAVMDAERFIELFVKEEG